MRTPWSSIPATSDPYDWTFLDKDNRSNNTLLDNEGNQIAGALESWFLGSISDPGSQRNGSFTIDVSGYESLGFNEFMIYIKPGNDGVYFLLDGERRRWAADWHVQHHRTGRVHTRQLRQRQRDLAHVAVRRGSTTRSQFRSRVRWHCWDWACSDSAWLAASRLPDPHCRSRRRAGPRSSSAGPFSFGRSDG